MTDCTLNKFKNNLDRFLNNLPDMALAQKYYPLPSDISSGLPSNSILDWIRFLKVPIRTNKSIEEIERGIKITPKYMDILDSEWRHLLPAALPPLQNEAIAIT